MHAHRHDRLLRRGHLLGPISDSHGLHALPGRDLRRRLQDELHGLRGGDVRLLHGGHRVRGLPCGYDLGRGGGRLLHYPGLQHGVLQVRRDVHCLYCRHLPLGPRGDEYGPMPGLPLGELLGRTGGGERVHHLFTRHGHVGHGQHFFQRLPELRLGQILDLRRGLPRLRRGHCLQRSGNRLVWLLLLRQLHEHGRAYLVRRLRCRQVPECTGGYQMR